MKVYIVKYSDGGIEVIFNNEQDAINYCNEWNRDETYCKTYKEYEIISGKFKKVMYEGDYYYWMEKVGE